MEYKFIQTEAKGEFAIVNINPTQGFNLLTKEMMAEIVDAIENFDHDDAVKVIILKGNDKSFCYGIDMQEFNREVNSLPQLWDVYRDLFVRLNRIKKLLIAEAAGYAIGFGVEIMLNCDIVIAAESLCLAVPEASLGIIPGMGLSKTLEKVIGKGKAMDMMLCGRAMIAEEAESVGLVSRIVPLKELARETEKTASKIAELPLSTIIAIKENISSLAKAEYESGIDETVERKRLLAASPEFHEYLSLLGHANS